MTEPADHDDETETPGHVPEIETPAAPATPPADESTVGTGTGIALGCIALTVFLTLIGVVVLLAIR